VEPNNFGSPIDLLNDLPMMEERNSRALSVELMVNGQWPPTDRKRKQVYASSLNLKDAQLPYLDRMWRQRRTYSRYIVIGRITKHAEG